MRFGDGEFDKDFLSDTLLLLLLLLLLETDIRFSDFKLPRDLDFSTGERLRLYAPFPRLLKGIGLLDPLRLLVKLLLLRYLEGLLPLGELLRCLEERSA